MGEGKKHFHLVILLWIDTATPQWGTWALKPCGFDSGEESVSPGEWGIPGCTEPIREERSSGKQKKTKSVKPTRHQCH